MLSRFGEKGGISFKPDALRGGTGNRVGGSPSGYISGAKIYSKIRGKSEKERVKRRPTDLGCDHAAYLDRSTVNEITRFGKEYKNKKASRQRRLPY